MDFRCHLIATLFTDHPSPAIQGEVLATPKLCSLAVGLTFGLPNVLVAMNFFFPRGLREMPCFKGFGDLSILFDKKSFNLLSFFAGNLLPMF